ncbi:hypothetical protein BT69DRAFT_1342276 [Atractiella rhizophila]|nr:hypothetical protein BT69DRAFT_1342276 [Atractiella rhizophila]
MSDPSSTPNLRTGFGYKGDPLSCNITSIGITYYYGQQSFVYGVCANCSVSGTPLVELPTNGQTSSLLDQTKKDDDEEMVIGLCTNFDQSFSNLPSWTKAGQQLVQNSIYGFSPFLARYQFANNTFNQCRFGPYGGAGVSAHAFSVSLVFLCGEVLAISGIGGLAIHNYNTAALPPQPEPDTIGELRNKSIGICSFVMEQALGDLHNRSLVSSYLCTVKSKEWKNFWTILAVVLGNNAALFGVFLYSAQYIAERIDLARHGPATITVDPNSFDTSVAAVAMRNTKRSRSGIEKDPSIAPFTPPTATSGGIARSLSTYKPPISFEPSFPPRRQSSSDSSFGLPTLSKSGGFFSIAKSAEEAGDGEEEKRTFFTEEPASFSNVMKRAPTAPQGPRPALFSAPSASTTPTPAAAPAYTSTPSAGESSPGNGTYIVNSTLPLPSPGLQDEEREELAGTPSSGSGGSGKYAPVSSKVDGEGDADADAEDVDVEGLYASKGRVEPGNGKWEGRWNYSSLGAEAEMESLNRGWAAESSSGERRGLQVPGFLKNLKASRSRDKLLK